MTKVKEFCEGHGFVRCHGGAINFCGQRKHETTCVCVRYMYVSKCVCVGVCVCVLDTHMHVQYVMHVGTVYRQHTSYRATYMCTTAWPGAFHVAQSS